MRKFLVGREVQSIVAIILIVSVFNWPYGYYQFLHWAVFLASTYFGFQAKREGKIWWAIGFVGIALIFNPFQPIYLHRKEWFWLDVVSALIFIAFLPHPKIED